MKFSRRTADLVACGCYRRGIARQFAAAAGVSLIAAISSLSLLLNILQQCGRPSVAPFRCGTMDLLLTDALLFHCVVTSSSESCQHKLF
jgi:hypothetical protein